MSFHTKIASRMDLTCPSLLLDQLTLNDQTSDYGSRETSDSESAIGGLCQLKYRQGLFVSFQASLIKFIYEYIFDFQKGHWSSEGAIFSFIQMTLKVIDDNKWNEFKNSYQQRSCCAAILISVPFLPSLLMVLSYVSNWTPLLFCSVFKIEYKKQIKATTVLKGVQKKPH